MSEAVKPDILLLASWIFPLASLILLLASTHLYPMSEAVQPDVLLLASWIFLLASQALHILTMRDPIFPHNWF